MALWSGLAVVKHAQDALNLQWRVPRFRQPGFVSRTVRAVGALAVVGAGIVLATVATNLAAFLPGAEGATRVLGSTLAIVVNILVLTTSYRVLVGTRSVGATSSPAASSGASRCGRCSSWAASTWPG